MRWQGWRIATFKSQRRALYGVFPNRVIRHKSRRCRRFVPDAERQSPQARDSQAHSRRSSGVNFTRLFAECCGTPIWCRSAQFSSSRAARGGGVYCPYSAEGGALPQSGVIRSCICIFFSLGTVNCLAQRQPVLKQIDLPHSYYYREMYLPQLTTGPSAVAWPQDSRT